MPTWSLTVEISEAGAEDVAAELFERGAAGVEIRDSSVAAMPGARQPGDGRALLVASFTTRERAEEARAITGGGEVEVVPDEDWGEAWKRGLEPFSVGRVFIRFSWTDAPPPAGSVEIVLDPGMAFGTGSHPTTALCLGALDRELSRRPGAAVLDVGTGSGLLAIAAARLGARRVAGTENDAAALEVARENAARNGVSVELSLSPPASVTGRFDVVVANILANTLVELAPEVASKVAPGGALYLSGLLAGQEEQVREAYAACGLTPDRARDGADREWRLVALAAPGGRGDSP